MVISFSKQKTHKTPPLENGDRLSGSKFRHRYMQMSENQKAGQKIELIESRVSLSDSNRFESYSDCQSSVLNWLGIYSTSTPGTETHSDTQLCLGADNILLPSAVLRLEGLKGRSRISSASEIEGSPELVVEIAASRATVCLREKLQAYRRNGVSEYIVWQVLEERIDWFQLQTDSYVNAIADKSNVLKSEAFPGLWLDVQATLSKDIRRVAAVRQAGLEGSQRKAFLNQLAKV